MLAQGDLKVATISPDELTRYLNCITQDCTDGPQVEGRRRIGVPLSTSFPPFEGEASLWSRIGNEFARAAEHVPHSAAVASVEAAARKVVSWADEEPADYSAD